MAFGHYARMFLDLTSAQNSLYCASGKAESDPTPNFSSIAIIASYFSGNSEITGESSARIVSRVTLPVSLGVSSFLGSSVVAVVLRFAFSFGGSVVAVLLPVVSTGFAVPASVSPSRAINCWRRSSPSVASIFNFIIYLLFSCFVFNSEYVFTSEFNRTDGKTHYRYIRIFTFLYGVHS